ncbi:MAG: hypothetical protein HY730_10420 [Candidatus Tectomicrobia bacterium]|uniref:Rhodanese domain-containing protein n=1 Tax=Tectimicrobiota bacterium TaxID=2528274 RepID=A0A933GMR2_UNCTE|nr:hypothetical protein [Candidatus Tectomicrobia bacterium]
MNIKKLYWNLIVLVIILTGLSAIGCSGVIKYQKGEGGDVKTVNKEDLRSMWGNPDLKVVDVRLESQWRTATEKILTSVREDPEKDIGLWSKKYPKDGIFVFYCD